MPRKTKEEKGKEKYENLKKCRRFIIDKSIDCDLKDFQIYVDIFRHLNSINTTK